MKWWKIVLLVFGGIFVIGIAVFLLFFGGQKGHVSIIAGSPVKLVLDDNEYGEGKSFSARLPVGNHKLEATIVGMAGKTPVIKRYFEVAKNSESIIEIAMDPTVEFSSVPQGADVFVEMGEQKRLGKTPFSIQMPAGNYKFTFVLNGARIEKGPYNLEMDSNRTVDAYYGIAPRTGFDDKDKFFISSWPDFMRVYENGELVGITPVSFPNKGIFEVWSGESSISLPVLNQDTQYFFVDQGTDGLGYTFSKKQIVSAKSDFVTSTGFFVAWVDGVTVRVKMEGTQDLVIPLPRFDSPLLLSSNSTTITFSGIFGSDIVIKTYEVPSGKEIPSPSIYEALRSVLMNLQSEDGKTDKYFFISKNSLFEADFQSMKCINLGQIPTACQIRRLGPMSDFAVGVFLPDGKCGSILSARYAQKLDYGWNAGFAPRSHADVYAFWSGKELIGLNIATGEIDWRHEFDRSIICTLYDPGENLWYVDFGDWNKLQPVEAQTGNLLEERQKDQRFTMASPNDGLYLGHTTVENFGQINLFASPDGQIVAKSSSGELWRKSLEGLVSSNCFDPSKDIGMIYAKGVDEFMFLDLLTGEATISIGSKLVSFPTADSAFTDKGFWIKGQLVAPKCKSVSYVDGSFIIGWTDDVSCLIIP